MFQQLFRNRNGSRCMEWQDNREQVQQRGRRQEPRSHGENVRNPPRSSEGSSNLRPEERGDEPMHVEDQLKLQLFRVYASVNRQHEWFLLHEANARLLLAEAEKLRLCFLPDLPSLAEGLQNDAHTCPTQQPPELRGAVEPSPFELPCASLPSATERLDTEEGGCRGVDSAVQPSAAWRGEDCWVPSRSSEGYGVDPTVITGRHCEEPLNRLVPYYLLQLTPAWVHEQLGSQSVNLRGDKGMITTLEDSTTSLMGLLLPILRSLRDILGLVHWRMTSGGSDPERHPDISAGGLFDAARHLFYLLHEVLSCMSLRLVPSRALSDEERVEALQILDFFSREWERLMFVMCGEGSHSPNDTCHNSHHGGPPLVSKPVPPSVVGEAFSFLSSHYLQSASAGSDDEFMGVA
uniref:Uncharacterized protein n=1 Tax=Trypanosoma congolense (strain IL3000) TaxID=1068625 RepID=G0UJG5_TRYCI|nr:conserved hypothetical protein [Trypanosoma congolense IL3000]